ncbi:MAG: MtnX-like HAD-IB family phosphatase [Deltaproteobacteria bacterium]
MERKLKFFIDFDGTVVASDICASMVMKYAGQGWAELNALWEQEVLSTGECAQRTLDLMQVTPGELDDFFMRFELDPGFEHFVGWAAGRGYPLLILSDGYDNYIELIQKKYGLDIEYYANHLEYDAGWQFRSIHSNPECMKCGVCKSRLVRERIEQGVTNIYIGDGYSDRCAAAICDVVFAKKSLAAYCEKEGIDYIAYHDFYDIVSELDEMLRVKKG